MNKSIERNVREVLDRIEGAAFRAGRDPASVTLLVATKNRSPREILEAIEAGVTVIGENRVQEMLVKVPEIGERARWQFIGHLQRNKVGLVVGVVELIHSVDSARLAREINERAARAGKKQAILLQVNVAGEEGKFGLQPEEVGDLLEDIDGLDKIEVIGLSTMAPFVEDPEGARPFFRQVRELGFRLDGKRNFRCDELSMGMTNDFEVAVEEGSTIVRIGTAIFDLD